MKICEILQTMFEEICHFFFFENNQKCEIDVRWVGSGRGRLRPVQNDRTGFPEVFEWILTTKSLKKTMKIRDFLRVFKGFYSWTLAFLPGGP